MLNNVFNVRRTVGEWSAIGLPLVANWLMVKKLLGQPQKSVREYSCQKLTDWQLLETFLQPRTTNCRSL